MTSRPNSDKVICGVLEDDCRLPEEESSEKEGDNIFVLTSLEVLTDESTGTIHISMNKIYL